MQKKVWMGRRGRIILLIIIAIVVVFAIYILFSGVHRGVDNGAGQPAPAEPGGPTAPPDAQGGAPNDVPLTDESITSLYYYDPANAARYEAFAARRPELATEEIIWMVEANLDLQPYTDAVPAADPESYTVLVNKFFSLDQDFSPTDLVAIGNTMMRKDAAAALEEMTGAAATENIRLWPQSGYRSFIVQSSLYDQYSANNGSDAADTYSARPGFSENQTGLAVDLNSTTDAFEESPEGQWAAENSWLYGFILRFTKENTEITKFGPEPWHFRYIGLEDATRLKDNGFSSYEEYWVKFVKFSPPDAAPAADGG